MKIALIGYGKMGKAIEEMAIAGGHEVVLKISSGNSADLIRRNLKNCDVAIEFSTPESAIMNIKACLEAGIPVIAGTTGWLNELDTIMEYCILKNGAFLYASNFSIGVNILFAINRNLAKMLEGFPNYHPSIEEIHHTQKKDSPSGTAISLAEQIIENNKYVDGWVEGNEGKASVLEITSKRIDPAPGTHHVKWHSSIDDIEIIHTAHNRTGFAAGALAAASFIKDRIGIFNMKDVLGL